LLYATHDRLDFVICIIASIAGTQQKRLSEEIYGIPNQLVSFTIAVMWRIVRRKDIKVTNTTTQIIVYYLDNAIWDLVRKDMPTLSGRKKNPCGNSGRLENIPFEH
jgi:hypothetical protein